MATKLYTKDAALILEPMSLVNETKDKAMEADVRSIDEIYRREYEVGADELRELVEKMVILTHMYSREFQIGVMSGFGADLFSEMWNGVLKKHGVTSE